MARIDLEDVYSVLQNNRRTGGRRMRRRPLLLIRYKDLYRAFYTILFVQCACIVRSFEESISLSR